MINHQECRGSLIINSIHTAQTFQEVNNCSVSQEISYLLTNVSVNYCVHNSSPLDPTISEMSPVYIPTPCHTRFISILSSHLDLHLPGGLSFQVFQPKVNIYVTCLFHPCSSCLTLIDFWRFTFSI